mmetsp:Transcript_22282/g.27315  ORF Transcript_22282/g.27315 Transcript_22282/m.27315 type:complete len:134 (+) Transcript_22282:1147-1548(+)
MIRDICPEACDYCFEKVLPTASPTTFASTCQNNNEWYWFGAPKVTCRWIRNKELRRNDFCNRNEVVKEECPQSCGVCCEDDDTYSISKSDSGKNCEWIGLLPSRIERLCSEFKNGRRVDDACPKTCGMCLGPV